MWHLWLPLVWCNGILWLRLAVLVLCALVLHEVDGFSKGMPWQYSLDSWSLFETYWNNHKQSTYSNLAWMLEIALVMTCITSFDGFPWNRGRWLHESSHLGGESLLPWFLFSRSLYSKTDDQLQGAFVLHYCQPDTVHCRWCGLSLCCWNRHKVQGLLFHMLLADYNMSLLFAIDDSWN